MEVNSFDLIGFDLFGVDLNSIDINTDNSISVKDDYIPTTIKHYISGYITDGSLTFTFTVDGNDITVPVDSNGSWKWKIDREINTSADFSGSPTIIKIGIINLFEAVTANNVIIVFHQNVWNMIMREIDVQGSPIQVAYQNMIDNYDVTIANASFDSEIEYLESSGTQYINTNVFPNQDTSIELSMYANNSAQQDFFGASGDLNAYVYGAYNGASKFYDNYNDDIALQNSIIGGRLLIKKTKNVTEITGDSNINYTHSNSTFTATYSMYLFARRKIDGAYRPAKMKCYYLKIWDGLTLVRDFIPVRKVTTGYLYDKVSGNLFGNSGTGDFILGNDK